MQYYGWVLLKFITGFIIVIIHLNLSGKTQLSQMTPVDFIGNFVLGGVIGGVIYSASIPFSQYVIVLLLGVFLISVLNSLSKHIHFFRAVTIGQPIPIIKNGKFLTEIIASKKNKIDILNVSSQLHTQGVNSFQEVSYAQIEPNGQLTVVCEGTKIPSLIIMKDGRTRTGELNKIDKDEEWLDCEMKRADVSAEEVFIAEFWDGNVTFILSNGEVKKASVAGRK